jgi:hypothetical protein
MSDWSTFRFSAATLQEFVQSYNSMISSLPAEIASRLRAILQQYAAAYGIEGAFVRMNGRTLSQVFAEYHSVDIQPIASGEVEGLRYELYDPPAPPPEHEREPDKEI